MCDLTSVLSKFIIFFGLFGHSPIIHKNHTQYQQNLLNFVMLLFINVIYILLLYTLFSYLPGILGNIKMLPLSVILSTISLFMVATQSYIIILLSYYSNQGQINFYRSVDRINMHLQSNNLLKLNYYRSARKLFIMMSKILIVYSINIILLIINNYNALYFSNVLITNIFTIFNIIKSVQYIFFTMIVKEQLRNLYQNLSDLCECDDLDLVITDFFKIHRSNRKNILLHKLLALKRCYSQIWQAADLINGIFGVPLWLIVQQLFFDSLTNGLWFFIVYSQRINVTIANNFDGPLWGFIPMTLVVLIARTGEDCNIQIKDILKQLHGMNVYLAPELRTHVRLFFLNNLHFRRLCYDVLVNFFFQIRSFSLQIINQPIIFTGIGLFSVNYTLLVDVIRYYHFISAYFFFFSNDHLFSDNLRHHNLYHFLDTI